MLQTIISMHNCREVNKLLDDHHGWSSVWARPYSLLSPTCEKGRNKMLLLIGNVFRSIFVCFITYFLKLTLKSAMTFSLSLLFISNSWHFDWESLWNNKLSWYWLRINLFHHSFLCTTHRSHYCMYHIYFWWTEGPLGGSECCFCLSCQPSNSIYSINPNYKCFLFNPFDTYPADGENCCLREKQGRMFLVST